mgnify:CR=1 FL=1
MMGLYFAATGFGNKLAGEIGEAAQATPVEINLVASKTQLLQYADAATIAEDKDFVLKANIYEKDGQLVLLDNTKANRGDAKDYSGVLEVYEVQNQREFKTFLAITALTTVFGILILLFLQRLKALTHGAEELERAEKTV